MSHSLRNLNWRTCKKRDLRAKTAQKYMGLSCDHLKVRLRAKRESFICTVGRSCNMPTSSILSCKFLLRQVIRSFFQIHEDPPDVEQLFQWGYFVIGVILTLKMTWR